MTVLVDTSIVIDVLRGEPAAAALLRGARQAGPVHASEVTRMEVLAGMRPNEEDATQALLGVFTWHAFDAELAELAGKLGREWLPGNRGIDSADLAIAATAVSLDVRILTRNVKHFPMFAGLTAPSYGHERVGVTRHGKLAAVVFSVEDLELLEALEDARDAVALRAARAEDDGTRVTLDELRRELDA